ncbi:hypothetical protein B0F90DRAFT_1743566 [Multifurca ochricompacta]|uniref:Uncharacterized protein n=1 Tax=Multifurca ochricompacta TaxID=376703 RepID=A0AAD4LZX5_9AGAM|nr:hypothetical protein B0F90DRAFT_1743566 [Multifurca ochricompacta]
MVMNDVREATWGKLPPSVLDFFHSLDQKRVILQNSPDIPSLSGRLNTPFEEHFRHPADSNEAAMTTKSEIGQYLHILSSSEILNEHNFRVNKEDQIVAIFLLDLAGQFRRLANEEGTKAGFGNVQRLRYTPRSGFRLEIRKFPHCILEVASSTRSSLEVQQDLWCMILQASCLARLGNRLRDANHHEYLVYQPNPSRREVRKQGG